MTNQDFVTRILEFTAHPGESETDPIAFHRRALERLDRVERTAIYIIDMAQMRYVFLPSVRRFSLAWDMDRVAEVGATYFFDHMHSEDRQMVMESVLEYFRFLYSIGIDERPKYKLSMDFRIANAGSNWVRIIQQVLAIELTEGGEIWLLLTVNDLSPVRDESVPARRFVEHVDTGERVLFPPEDAEVGSPLTPRELEVLGLVSRGYGSREVADFLGISVNTVNNHRQHVLEKMRASNTAEALSYAASLSLI